jgi:cytochrome c
MVGPNLSGFLTRRIGSAEGFDYSSAMGTMTGSWTADRLDAFLEKPGHEARGTSMTFRGIRNAADRAAVISWLMSEGRRPPPGTEGHSVSDILATGDPEAGRRMSRRCQACHSTRQGQDHKIGPNLYGILGRRIASAKGFDYSARLRRRDGIWTPEQLNAFMFEKKAFDQGSHMAFHSLSGIGDRADLIAWLATLVPPE